MTERDNELPRWIVLAGRAQVAVVGLVIAVPAAIIATFVPYQQWDAQAFGYWSRLIAASGHLFPDDIGPGSLHRPLFYVLQGLGWRWIDDGEWVGRWLGLAFSAVFVASVWWLAGRIVDGPARALLRPLAVSVALASSVFVLYMEAGLSDVPVAATASLTAVVTLSRIRLALRLPLVALTALSTALAKPTGFLALLGIAAAAAIILWTERRRMLGSLAALAAGCVAGLVYHGWQAHRLGIAFGDELSSGNSEFWRERGASARWDALLRAEWLGEGVRLVVLAGLVFSVARVVGARPHRALAIAGPGAAVLSIAAPLAAGDGVPYPFDGPSWLGIAAWLVFAGTFLAAALLDGDDPVPRRVHGGLLAWIVPGVVVWIAVRADETRFLSPIWAPLVLAAAIVLAVSGLALARARPWLALAPAVAITLAVVANVVAIDGLDARGWRELVEKGPSGWTDPAAMENFAYGTFGDELAAVRKTIGADGRIVSSDARLPYFFPRRVAIRYPIACADVESGRAFILLLGDESAEQMREAGGPADPLAWEQCKTPRLQPVASHDGIYAVYAVGDPPQTQPTPDDCRVSGTPGTLLDGVFADGVNYAEAREIRDRAAAVGYTVARIERTGCGTYQVVVTGIPTPRANQQEFLRESAGAGFDVEIRPPMRYPEVPPDVEPAPASR